jgi:hypothetical protein
MRSSQQATGVQTVEQTVQSTLHRDSTHLSHALRACRSLSHTRTSTSTRPEPCGTDHHSHGGCAPGRHAGGVGWHRRDGRVYGKPPHERGLFGHGVQPNHQQDGCAQGQRCRHRTHGILPCVRNALRSEALPHRTHRRTASKPTSPQPNNGRAGTHYTDNRDDRYTAYTEYTARFPVVRTHARTYRYTVVHHYRFARVHHFRYEHVDESTPFAPR